MAGASSHVPVKVVYIDTQYVETDPLSFKSVVQSLTGMNSTVTLMEESSSLPCHKRKRCGGSNSDGKSGGSNSLNGLSTTMEFERFSMELRRPADRRPYSQ
ncbi:hypothetical protein RHSIM_Rhsim13G0113700 [Rhododendron simsii]|uniref:VQ domain-containing protein n=1 Tax=Rhododendron simsii TaxID=118357 RepID=A0A834G2E4_RHOSS|nr:hypothetical protein RHSIM_Rhsim13G0113700 [Rhododendron simsii]